MLALTLGSQWSVLRIPEEAPAAIPVGPYKLSIQPGIGSLAVDTTVKKIIT